MLWFMVLQMVSTLVKLIQLRGTSASDKELEILLLRRHLMTHYQDQLLACDFFTIDTLFLCTLYVLIFIEIGSRRVHFAGWSAHPDNAWITQQARQVMWELDEHEPAIHVLIRANDKKFSHAFDTVFRSAGMPVIPIPAHVPNANAYAERWIRSVREECLDKVLILNQAHVRRVMREYIAFSIRRARIRGLTSRFPSPQPVEQRAARCAVARFWVASFMTTTATRHRRE